MKILIVDDYRPFAQSLKVMLSPLHDGRVVGTGAEAMAALSSEPFDAAFVDLKLPDMSGLEICREIAQRSIPLPAGVVIITGGGGDAALWSELAKLGVKVIEKPFTPDKLLALLSAR